MSLMIKEEDFQAHVKKNLELLNEVVQHETEERVTVKKNLSDFHEAVNEHKKIVDASLDKKHSEDLTTLDEQLAQLKNFLSSQLPE